METLWSRAHCCWRGHYSSALVPTSTTSDESVQWAISGWMTRTLGHCPDVRLTALAGIRRILKTSAIPLYLRNCTSTGPYALVHRPDHHKPVV